MKLWIALALGLTVAGCGAVKDVFWDSSLKTTQETLIV